MSNVIQFPELEEGPTDEEIAEEIDHIMRFVSTAYHLIIIYQNETWLVSDKYNPIEFFVTRLVRFAGGNAELVDAMRNCYLSGTFPAKW